ncbi:MAG TPA: response regulator [Pyrinomonadaceae bacterium]|nr:response regulator [Pyrinomonadaceae bacterium]
MSKTIVWIEDEYDIIYPVIYPFEKAGYQVINISNTKAALDQLEQLRQADLILLDTFLPPGADGKDYGNYPGVRFFRELREVHNIQTPVVVFTVLAHSQLLEEFKQLGAADIVRKPVRPSELKERVERVLGDKGSVGTL